MQERNIAKTRDYTLYLQVFWKLKVFYILVQCIQPNITINREWRQNTRMVVPNRYDEKRATKGTDGRMDVALAQHSGETRRSVPW